MIVPSLGVQQVLARSGSGPTGLRVQYGCGPGPVPTGWTNFDTSPTLRLSRIPGLGRLLTGRRSPFDSATRYGDVVLGLPVPDVSCSAVYSSHVLEHLTRSEVATALAESRRILMPGGVLRLVLPDLRQLVLGYVAGELTGDDFVEQLGMGDAAGTRRQRLVRYLGNSSHLWMWDEDMMRNELIEAGFCNVRRAQMGDCETGQFDDVEIAARWDGCLGMQAERPKE